MSAFFLMLLALPAWPRHIIEGPVGEIAQAAEAAAQLDGEVASPQTTPERRAEAQAERTEHVDRISKVAAAHPRDLVVNLAAAESLVRVREPARAEQAAERAVAAAPDNPDAYMLRGRARMEQGRYEDAVRDFKETLRLRPGDTGALASLKLSEGRTSHAASVAPALPAPAAPGNVAPSAVAAMGLSEFDRQAVEKSRLNRDTISHYNAALMAQAAGDGDKALTDVEKALSLQPDAPFLLEFKAALVAGRAAAKESPKAPASSRAQSEPEGRAIGAGNFMGGFMHYLGGSGEPRRVNFNDIDTSRVRVIDFEEVAAELKKALRNDKIHIRASRPWATSGSRGLLIGNLTLLLKGTLSVREDCRWSFEGSLRAFDDRYDFNEGARDWAAETLTAFGRKSPGRSYRLEIRGARPILESGIKEDCR